MTDSIRAEFNTWWDRQPFNAQFEEFKPQMFNVWVASRAECVVELPKYSLYANTVGDYARGYSQARADDSRAITAAGLKVRT